MNGRPVRMYSARDSRRQQLRIGCCWIRLEVTILEEAVEKGSVAGSPGSGFTLTFAGVLMAVQVVPKS